METTEKIVEAYVRYVRRWATIPNIRCEGQYEIDLLAIDPVTLKRYHIETSISISGGFSRLTANPFDPNDLKVRVKIASARRTLGYFRDRKFVAPGVRSRLSEYGFKDRHYKRVIVTWGWTDDAKRQADAAGIELWDFRKIVNAIAKAIKDQRSHFGDDTLRTISLFVRAQDEGANIAAQGASEPMHEGGSPLRRRRGDSAPAVASASFSRRKTTA
jgi:hypothetical protein